VALPLLVHTPELEAVRLRAQLVQLTSGLAVPIGAEFDMHLSERVPAREGEIELPVRLPPVKRETDFELRIRSRRDPAQVWELAGRVPLRVYPPDLLDPVRRWATSHPLRVKDGDGSLIGFLRQQKVPVAGAAVPRDSRGVTLYAGPAAVRARVHRPLRDGETIVLFTERETEIPRFLIERAGRGTTVIVEMRLIDRLVTDPLAQKMFLEVFALVHEERPSIGGNVR
jgi:hypothetical protein